jgi:hypothetical protein
MLVNASLVAPHAQPASDGSTAVAAAQTLQQINPNIAQTDDQTEGTLFSLVKICALRMRF